MAAGTARPAPKRWWTLPTKPTRKFSPTSNTPAAGVGGWFRAGQLTRPLQPAANASRWRSWLSAVLAVGGVLGAGQAAGQALKYGGGPEPVTAAPGVVAGTGATTTEAPAARPAAPATKPGEPALVSGTVLDQKNARPLPGVTVLVAGTTIGTSTDVDGYFSLPAEAAGGRALTVSFIGYQTQQLPAAASTASQPLVVKLAADIHMLTGEVVVIRATGRILPPAPWHPRRLYYWGKYWATRPFRR